MSQFAISFIYLSMAKSVIPLERIQSSIFKTLGIETFVLGFCCRRRRISSTLYIRSYLFVPKREDRYHHPYEKYLSTKVR